MGVQGSVKVVKADESVKAVYIECASVKADESVLRTVYIECATFKHIPASEEYQASTAYFLQPLFAAAHFFTLLPPLRPPGFPLRLFLPSPPTSPGAALRLLLLLPLFSYSKVPELSQKAGQKGHPAQYPASDADLI